MNSDSGDRELSGEGAARRSVEDGAPAAAPATGSESRLDLLIRGNLITDGTDLGPSWVGVADGMITRIGTGSAPPATATMEVAHLVPGFVDLHCHGAAGGAYDDGLEAIIAARAHHLRHGTTASMLSLVTARPADLIRRIAVIRAAAAADPQILGVHLEGPCLSHDKRGAHDPTLLRPPDPELITGFSNAAGDLRTMITLAPELDGAMTAIRTLSEHGWVVALGHTDASYETGVRAIAAGARLITHAFNGMRGLDHRSPGILPAALDDPRVNVEVIADGEHVHPRMVRFLFDTAPGRVALITDAMAATGQPDGRWKLGDLGVVVTDGLPRLVDTGSIAGSTLTQDKAIRVAVAAGVPLRLAVAAATGVPAGVLGLTDTHGAVRVGRRADLVGLDADLQVCAVIADGVRVG